MDNLKLIHTSWGATMSLSEKSLSCLFYSDIVKNFRGYESVDEIQYGIKKSKEYPLNSHTFRSAEFHPNTETIFAGCSHTFGVGIDEEFMWSNRVSKHFNFDSVNMGFIGGSVGTIVKNILAYVRKYGLVKNIFCLFPPFVRLLIPMNGEVIVSKEEFKNRKDLADNYLDHIYFYDSDLPKYSKKPHLGSDILTVDFGYYDAIQSINLLEMFCNMLGINLLWGLWDDIDYNNLLDMKKDGYYQNLISLENNKWSFNNDEKKYFCHVHNNYYDKCDNTAYCQHIAKCHQDDYLRNPKEFEVAADMSHFGNHRNIHIADIFIKKYNERFKK